LLREQEFNLQFLDAPGGPFDAASAAAKQAAAPRSARLKNDNDDLMAPPAG
jgi:hypothetical protein